ncbi:DUF1285 domain-containing protein [Shewanella sp. AS1]|uniref:DUF1285 domain-containing protein n=1 Tax=Shewanella sp. AS1 TaxID=2907626 RepID=UPI001F196549|nr:DUF1285 domain-containing protein [Shewanella sp. AS1]MCE9678316.1 DUF1285 domain-containing protein [Shewanella sp. AS1]
MTENPSQDAQTQLHSLTQGAELCSDKPLFFIDAKGEWLYRQGRLPEKFCRLFCSILHCIDGQYYLITPVEKCLVEVSDSPLLVVDYELLESGELSLSTSIGADFNAADFTCFQIEEQA